MTRNPIDRATDARRSSAPWVKHLVYDRGPSAAIGAATMALCAVVYFELNRHYWFSDLIGREHDPKINAWFLIGLFLLTAFSCLSPRPPARSWASTGMGVAGSSRHSPCMPA